MLLTGDMKGIVTERRSRPSPTSIEGRLREAATPLPSGRIEPGPAKPDAHKQKHQMVSRLDLTRHVSFTKRKRRCERPTSRMGTGLRERALPVTPHLRRPITKRLARSIVKLTHRWCCLSNDTRGWARRDSRRRGFREARPARGLLAPALLRPTDQTKTPPGDPGGAWEIRLTRRWACDCVTRSGCSLRRPRHRKGWRRWAR
jgi:hypothetical protein